MTAHRDRPWLVTGAQGMLARDVLRRLAAAGRPAVAATRRDLDLTDPEAVRAAFAAHRPAVVVNCAAWTAVDAAEEHEAEALAINATGPRVLAESCRTAHSVLLQVSTDYVFDGHTRTPYPEDARTAPRTAYGRTKLAGEQAVRALLPDTGYVIRTAWLYGAGGRSFVRTAIDLERTRPTVDVVNDQWGQPTWTGDLADHLTELGRRALAGTAPPGVYHGTSGGATTWFALCQEVFRLLGADPARVRPTTSDRYVRPAPRPAYSALAHDRWQAAGMPPIRHWRTALAEAFPTLHPSAAGGAGAAGAARVSGDAGVSGGAGAARATGVSGGARAARATGVSGGARAARATGVSGGARAAGVSDVSGDAGVLGSSGASGVTKAVETTGTTGTTGTTRTTGTTGTTASHTTTETDPKSPHPHPHPPSFPFPLPLPLPQKAERPACDPCP